MTTLEELKRQVARLKQERESANRRFKAEREVRENFIKRDAEKRMLKKQLFVLKHPRLIKSASYGLSIGKSGLSSLVSAAKKYHKYQQKKSRRR